MNSGMYYRCDEGYTHTCTINHFIVDEEMVRTRPTGGYRKEYGT